MEKEEEKTSYQYCQRAKPCIHSIKLPFQIQDDEEFVKHFPSSLGYGCLGSLTNSGWTPHPTTTSVAPHGDLN